MNENLIDRYLLNLLSSEEKDSFEAQLKNDEPLRKKVLMQQNLINSIEGFGRIELKTKLQKIHKDISKDKKGSSSNIRFIVYRLAIASAFIGFFSIGWWWMNQSTSVTNIYAKHFEPFELSVNQRSGDNDALIEIERLYSNGDYDQVIPLFLTTLQNSQNKSSQLLLGLGNSYLQTDQYLKAISQFNAILDKKDFNFEDEAFWYLGMTYLKLEDEPKAKSYLTQLANDTTRDHHEEAKSILSQLDK